MNRRNFVGWLAAGALGRLQGATVPRIEASTIKDVPMNGIFARHIRNGRAAKLIPFETSTLGSGWDLRRF
jgi:hypothetical protein